MSDKPEEFRINHPKYLCAAVALGLGVSVFVLSLMKVIDPAAALPVLALGVAAAGLGLFFVK